MGRLSKAVLDVGLWLPMKMACHFLRPVTTVFESLTEAADQLAGLTNEEIDAYFSEQPL